MNYEQTVINLARKHGIDLELQYSDSDLYMFTIFRGNDSIKLVVDMKANWHLELFCLDSDNIIEYPCTFESGLTMLKLSTDYRDHIIKPLLAEL